LVEQNLESLSPLLIRKQLEDIFLKASSWWLKQSNLSGLGAQMIVVCCHMDSTANNEGIYEKTVDPAPGVDDNCSGVCATLAIARYLAKYRGKLTHTVRFCFFNAEEEGLFGSQAYASYLKNQNATIKAVINLDMMGFNKDEGRIFEIHAGYTDPVVRDLCLPIADTIKQWAAKLGKLGDGQIYKGTIRGGPEDYDRDKFDGAIRRSDHWSFQHHGYPGCHLSEDFFANLPTEPGRDANPNYHTFSDKVIDIAYSVDITSAATFALKELASK
jgi:Zn-dependent M28 family amino/carboxypeptidase